MRLSGGGVLFEHYRGLDKNALEAVNNNSNSSNCATSVQQMGVRTSENPVLVSFVYKTQSSQACVLSGFGALIRGRRRLESACCGGFPFMVFWADRSP